MTAPAPKTMLNYFTKLPSEASTVEKTNPRRLAPAYNKQHVEKFQKDKLEQFDAELFNSNNDPSDSNKSSDILHSNIELITDNNQIISTNYIESIKTGQYKPFKVQQGLRGPLRSKLFQYCEDVRPAYFGTWQKKTTRITGRRPYDKDESVFDYEVDSEAEWDIGGPGESLKGDDSEDDEELDDYEIDMKTFVPHGYVSDDEIEGPSDHEDNGSSSANQSVEEVVTNPEEDSNASVQIIREKRIKLTTVGSDSKQQVTTNVSSTVTHNKGPKKVNSSTMQQAAPMPQIKQPKTDIKPIVLGLYYEKQEPAVISESKIHFLQTFKGYLCS